MSAAVREALEWVGTPYVHGASAKGLGCDCLGLIRGVWRGLGREEPEAPPPYGPDWAEAAGRETLLEACARHMSPAAGEIAVGQVLLFRMREAGPAKHLGLTVSDERFVHAYQGHGVIVSPLSTPWRRRIAAHFVFPQEV